MSRDKFSRGGFGYVEGTNNNDLHPIHGVAIAAGDVTVGAKSGERKLWKRDALEPAVDSLEGKEIVVDHENRSAREVIGQVEETMIDENGRVLYKGVIDDGDIASKIERGWLEVSPRLKHGSDMDERGPVKVPNRVKKFDNLSVVNRGASPSNFVETGEPEEFAEELESAFESQSDNTEEYHVFEELQDIDLSNFLYDNYQGAIGAAEGMPDCNSAHEIVIDGDTWYLPCQNREQLINALSQMNDEEMNEFSPMKPREGQMVRWQIMPEIIGEVVHVDQEKQIAMVRVIEPESASGMTFTSGYEDVVPQQMSVEEMAQFNQGDWVQWDWSGGKAFGKVTEIVNDGSRTVEGNTRSVSEEDDEQIAVIDQVNEEGESQNQRVIKIIRDSGENENGLSEWSPSTTEEGSEFVELTLSESRTPEYDGTETQSWGDIPAGTLTYWTDSLGYDAEQVDDLSESQKNEIAQHTLLGDSEADNVRELRFFPVVNAETGNLNRGALEAVRSGRGQSADIPEATYESAYRVAGRLLNDEFDADVEAEMTEELQTHMEEKKRIAGQISSWSSLTRPEAMDMLNAFDPENDVAAGSFVEKMKEVLERVESESENDGDNRLLSSLEELKDDGELESLASKICEMDRFEDFSSDDIADKIEELQLDNQSEENSILNEAFEV